MTEQEVSRAKWHALHDPRMFYEVIWPLIQWCNRRSAAWYIRHARVR